MSVSIGVLTLAVISTHDADEVSGSSQLNLRIAVVGARQHAKYLGSECIQPCVLVVEQGLSAEIRVSAKNLYNRASTLPQ